MQLTQLTPSVSAQNPSLPTVQITNGHATTLSTQVADYFGKRHDAVLRDIRNLVKKAPELRLHNFVETQQLVKVGAVERHIVVYRMDRKGFTLLAMGFTGEPALKFKIAYIDAFDEMEAKLRGDNLSQGNTLTPAQQLAIQQAVGRRAQKTANHYQTIYRAIKLRYQIARYDQLPQSLFEDCLRFIETVDLHTPEVVEQPSPLPVAHPEPKDPSRYLTENELSSLDRIHRFHRDPYFKIAYEVAYNALRAAHSRYAGRFYDVMTECDLSLFRIGRILERNGIEHF